MWRSRKRNRIWIATLAICTALGSGCAYLQVPRIDPTGQRVFAEGPFSPAPIYRERAGGQAPCDDVSVTLSPHVTVAPVGSEVVLLAGVCGSDGYLRTNRRLEWSLAPGGVGHFVDVGRGGMVDLLLGDFNRPRKVDNTFAIGSTSRKYLRLTRGTPTATDDVCVRSGEGWITVTSPAEGTSHVSVFAPTVYGWNSRTRSATVHWVDASWQFPPPAINPAGSTHRMTTSVMRQSDQAPCVGWLVRYQIAGGPPAGFAPDGVQSVEAVTDSAGQATVEVFQKAPGPGTNQIAIEIIRPAAVGGPGGSRLVIGSGTTTKTWTAAALAVRKTGPAVAAAGTTLGYLIAVSNPGDLPAEDVIVTDELPDVLRYVNANPAPEVAGRRLQWRIGSLAAGDSRTIELNCQAAGQGSVANCVEATASGGLKASDCATTTLIAPTVDVQTTGPQQATVGTEVAFDVVITNRSQVPTGKLLIRYRFDPGLDPGIEDALAKGAIERELGNLAPGESQRIRVTFVVTRAGQLSHTVEVSGADGVHAQARASLTAVAAPQTSTVPDAAAAAEGNGAETLVQPGPQLTARPVVTVKKTGPARMNKDQMARFTIDVTNSGNVALTNLSVVDRYDAALSPEMATGGSRFENNYLVWTLDRLAAGQTTQLDVHCRCLSETARTCNRVTVTSAEGARAEDEACLAILAASGKLNMAVADLLDPVRLGKELTYEVLVSNDGAAQDNQVVVVATVPTGMMPVAIGTSGPRQIRYTIEGQTVRFEAVPEIAPGEKLSYRIRVSTRQPGKLNFRAELTSRGRPEPLAVEEPTEVFP